MENGTKFATTMATKRNSHTTKVIAYAETAFTAGYGTALSAILRETEITTNLAFKDLCDIQDVAFSVTHPITGKEIEWKELVSDPLTSTDWTLSTSNKLGRMLFYGLD